MTSSVMTVDVYRIHAEVEATHWWFAGRRAVFEALACECLAPQHQPLVVDIGCSIGNNAALRVLGRRYVGVDPAPDAIRFAQQSHPREQFVCGTVGDREVDRHVGEADLIMLTDVLEHVADDRELLGRIVAVMRPGSQLLITVPADQTLWSSHDEALGHYRRYSRDELERLWNDLPVSVLLTSHFNARLYPLVKLVRTFNRWRGSSFGAANTDLKMTRRPMNWLLEKLFAGERRRLLTLLRGERGSGYRRGVSLIAILRRDEGHLPSTAHAPSLHATGDCHV